MKDWIISIYTSIEKLMVELYTDDLELFTSVLFTTDYLNGCLYLEKGLTKSLKEY